MKSIISKFPMNFSYSDENEESQIIGPDKTITIKKTTVHQTSMKSIISHFTMYFSYSDENGDHKSLVETKSSHLRKITTVRWDLNEVYHFKIPDKFFLFRWKWGIKNHWSRQNHHIQNETTANQTSMKSIISNFTMYFSYSDENGDHKSFVETKSSHLRNIATVRWDLNEVYHFKTHDNVFTFRWKWGIINHWSRQNHHI